ncbi:hypothetical protein B5J93_10610 [Moraxella equi]|uniref:Uncharacterized protein n=1 Tax=Moraxella equi TaxID=60442 RepID=A0ABX3NFH4_9GAMM|nr:hypothetical protein B5J93_10610 [Moraxella equi]
MTPTDFLAERQPTKTTAIITGYLHSFLKGMPLETGFAFENELKACQLDYTLASLQRIDDFLDNIRTTHRLDRDTFLNGGTPTNHTFLFLLTYYCGEMRGRLAGVAPIWQDYEEYIAENPEMQGIFPDIDEYRFVATYHRADNINQHFPLVAILERLFPEFDEPEKSVYFSTITGDYQAFAPDEVVPPANQSLPIDLQAACQNLSAHWQSYLQILPPKWMLGDELMSQIKAPCQPFTKKGVWSGGRSCKPIRCFLRKIILPVALPRLFMTNQGVRHRIYCKALPKPCCHLKNKRLTTYHPNSNNTPSTYKTNAPVFQANCLRRQQPPCRFMPRRYLCGDCICLMRC